MGWRNCWFFLKIYLFFTNIHFWSAITLFDLLLIWISHKTRAQIWWVGEITWKIFRKHITPHRFQKSKAFYWMIKLFFFFMIIIIIPKSQFFLYEKIMFSLQNHEIKFIYSTCFFLCQRSVFMVKNSLTCLAFFYLCRMKGRLSHQEHLDR